MVCPIFCVGVVGLSWGSSRRRERFNADWKRVRLAVLERDGWRCQFPVTDWNTGVRGVCGAPAREVDHKQRALHGVDDDSFSNLWALCRFHHGLKTAGESGEQRRVNRARGREKQWYEHPAFKAV